VHCLTGSALSVLVAALSTVVAEVVDKGAPTGMAEASDQFVMNSEEGDLDACAEALDQQRRQFEDEGKYEDAEQVKQRLELLQEKADAKRREALRQRQLAQRLGVEEAHMKELQEFNQHWDQKVAEFEAHAASLQSQLQDRHNQEFAEARKKFEMETEPRNPRFSKDLLNLRKIQDTLAKMKKYSEASKTKQQADVVEAKEREAWSAKRETKIRGLEEQFLHKQSLEMTGLTKRIVSGREEQKQARKLELQRLLQRYHNVKSQLESQQKIETWRSEKQTPRGRPSSGLSGSMSLSYARR